jgi:hypothetical protein
MHAQGVRFNNLYSLACHNCYEKKLATHFQDVFTYTKTIEIDIWNENFGLGLVASVLGKSMNEDWYVKHKPQQRGNKNNFGGSFRQCLQQVKAWSDNNPGHEVITVFIDKKQNWSGGQKQKGPADLDNLLLSVFSRDDIFTPADLQHNKVSLKKAAYANWPPVDSLRGRFVFVITDGSILNRRKPLVEYLQKQKDNAVCFVSPRVSSEAEVYKPKGFSKEAAANVVFYNLKAEHRALAGIINALECITRVYGSSKGESYDRLTQLVDEKINFVAFYNYRLSKEPEPQAPPKRKSAP